MKADWERLAVYSEKKNFGKANALYTSFNGGIDPGFLAAKMIKHAFKSYPKVSLRGQFTQLAPEPEEAPPAAEEIYGFNPENTAQIEQKSTATDFGDAGNVSDATKAAMLNAKAPDPVYTGTIQHSEDNTGF